ESAVLLLRLAGQLKAPLEDDRGHVLDLLEGLLGARGDVLPDGLRVDGRDGLAGDGGLGAGGAQLLGGQVGHADDGVDRGGVGDRLLEVVGKCHVTSPCWFWSEGPVWWCRPAGRRTRRCPRGRRAAGRSTPGPSRWRRGPTGPRMQGRAS